MHKLIVADQYKLWSWASPSNSSFFNDLINWVQYGEEFTGNSQQIVTGLISCSASIYDISFHSDLSRMSLPNCSSVADFFVGRIHTCIWTHVDTHRLRALTHSHTPGSIYNLQDDFPIVQCSGYCPKLIALGFCSSLPTHTQEQAHVQERGANSEV